MLVFSFLLRIGECLGLRAGGLSSNFLGRTGDERGLADLLEDEGEGGEGGRGSSETGYSFRVTTGEILGLLCAQRGFRNPLGEAAGLTCFIIPCVLVLGRVPATPSSPGSPYPEPTSPGVSVDELLGILSRDSMLRGRPSRPGDQSLSLNISERTWRARNADTSCAVAERLRAESTSSCRVRTGVLTYGDRNPSLGRLRTTSDWALIKLEFNKLFVAALESPDVELSREPSLPVSSRLFMGVAISGGPSWLDSGLLVSNSSRYGLWSILRSCTLFRLFFELSSFFC